MTTLSHLDSHFQSVFAIEAVNEPIMDATQTPGYGDCTSSVSATSALSLAHVHALVQKKFVQTIRTTEFILGIGYPIFDLGSGAKMSTSNVTSAISASVNSSKTMDPDVKSALLSSIPILVELSHQLGLRLDLAVSKRREPLVAK